MKFENLSFNAMDVVNAMGSLNGDGGHVVTVKVGEVPKVDGEAHPLVTEVMTETVFGQLKSYAENHARLQRYSKIGDDEMTLSQSWIQAAPVPDDGPSL